MRFSNTVSRQKPQYAFRNLVKNPHPSVKHHRLNFVAAVKRAEDKTVFRQSEIPAIPFFFSDGLGMIIYLIAVGHEYKILAIVSCMARGNDPVRDYIIEKVCSGRSREAEITDLDRGRAKRGDTEGIPLCVASQVHEDADLILMDACRSLGKRHAADISKLVAILNDPFPVIAIVILSVRIAENPEFIPLVQSEEVHDKMRTRMIMKGV